MGSTHPACWTRFQSYAAGGISAHAQKTATATGSGNTST